MGHSLGFYRYKIMVILASIICISIAKASGWSKFILIKSANSIDQSIVVETYVRTNSSRLCGMKCGQHAVESFYYVADSATCFCNNEPDGIMTEDQTGPMIYGYLVKHGSQSECQAYYDVGVRADGEFTTSAGKHILCNFTSLGWTVFQRRVDGNVDFQRNWASYVAGFGDQDGEFWLGLEAIHQMTTTGCELHIYLEAGPNTPNLDKGFARYANFSVDSAMTNYSLNLAGFSGTVGDSLEYQSGMQFSTYDADNDLSQINCALDMSCGWWYRGISTGRCAHSNLNSLYLAEVHNHWAGIRWEQPWGIFYSLLRTEMAFKC